MNTFFDWIRLKCNLCVIYQKVVKNLHFIDTGRVEVPCMRHPELVRYPFILSFICQLSTHSILSSTSRPVLLLAKEEEETFRDSSGWEASGRREEWWKPDREERWEGSGWEGKEGMSGKKMM